MADTIKGDGLFQAHGALAALVDDPRQLDRARRRFNDSPPSYKSHQSGTPTRSPSPDTRTEEERRRDEKEWQLRREHGASLPQSQFEAQTDEETGQIIQDNEDGTRRVPVGTVYSALAIENVKKRWAEQGIWDDKWDTSDNWIWKHEEPRTPELPDEGLFSLASYKRVQAENMKKHREQGQGQEHTSRAARERERDASRPFYQFIFQVSKKRERIQERLTPAEAAASGFGDINTKAYEEVRNTWIKWGIWSTHWGILPGMSWKHEKPLEQMLQEELGGEVSEALTPQQENPSAATPRPIIANQQAPALPEPSSSLDQPSATPPPVASNQPASAIPDPSPPEAAGPLSTLDSQHSPRASRHPEAAQKRLKRKGQSSHSSAEQPPEPQRRSRRLQKEESNPHSATSSTPELASVAKSSKLLTRKRQR
ncbi:hypothetical protein F5Y14DRAFT_418400 [Nemania sp. NC0429]|nr:hypothetical protein F5Y14DRAFT_418400 [Nemania sp. NC0429]